VHLAQHLLEAELLLGGHLLGEQVRVWFGFGLTLRLEHDQGFGVAVLLLLFFRAVVFFVAAIQ